MPQFRNPKLADAFKKWLEEASTFLRDKLPISKNIGNSGMRSVISYEHSGQSWSEVTVPQSPGGLLYDHRDEIPNLVSYQTVVNLLHTDPDSSQLTGKFVGTSAGAWLVEWKDLPERFIHEYWLVRRSLEYDDAAFASVYGSLEGFIYDNELPRTLTIPLQNFDSDGDSLNFGNGMNACLITPALYESLYLRGGTFRSEYRTEYRGLRSWLLTVQTSEKKAVRERDEHVPVAEIPWHKPYRLAESLIKVLRIYKDGSPTFHFVDECTPWAVQGGRAYPRVTFGKSDKLILLTNELADFNAFFSTFQKIDLKVDRFLRVAIDRFSNAMDRIAPEDSVIDLSICLEALLLSGLGSEEDRGNLSYRFALHGARLLGRDFAERKKFYRKLKKVYGIRSKIVHGAGSFDLPKDDFGKHVTMDQFRELLEELARACFRKFFSQFEDTGTTCRIDWDSVTLN
jgi:hypothetical protein